MNKEKTLSMLGLARRAGKLSMGHDMVQKSLYRGKSRCILFCSDVSGRLIKEFQKTMENQGISLPVFETDITIDEMHASLGYRAGVISVDDIHFSDKIIELLSREEIIYDN